MFIRKKIHCDIYFANFEFCNLHSSIACTILENRVENTRNSILNRKHEISAVSQSEFSTLKDKKTLVHCLQKSWSFNIEISKMNHQIQTQCGEWGQVLVRWLNSKNSTAELEPAGCSPCNRAFPFPEEFILLPPFTKSMISCLLWTEDLVNIVIT